ncbi:hypothetical protein [Nonomuraea sp. NPDC023979]|uniref:hypothetical protein n=1 Tax=Nonomuraea sp. NPDC023979 TaxID=3154796 RepID=UPI0033FA9C92
MLKQVKPRLTPLRRPARDHSGGDSAASVAGPELGMPRQWRIPSCLIPLLPHIEVDRSLYIGLRERLARRPVCELR